MERLRTKEQPRGPPDVGMEFWQGPPVVEAPGPVGVEAMEGRAGISARRPAVPVDAAPALEEIMWDSFLRRQAELEEYARMPLVAADTTDAESARRRRALHVVFEAIEAMGGKEALLTIRDMFYSRHHHKAYGPRSKYATYLPGGARIVYDGVRGWINIGGKAYPLQGQSLWEIKHRSERWDFLSRFLGEGIRLDYVGRRLFRDRWYHVIEVEDLKYGGTFRALFDEETHLLKAVEEPAVEEPNLRELYLDYRLHGSALVPHTVERTDLKKIRYARSSYSITYTTLSDDLFELSGNDSGWEGLDAFELQGTLWVEVMFTKQETPSVGVLPGAEPRLTLLQKDLIEQQVVEAVVRDVSRRGLFPRVLALPKAGIGRGFETGEYILRIELKSIRKITARGIIRINLYCAQLLDAVSRTVILQDGPPNGAYYFSHIPSGGPYTYRECLDYRLTFFAVEDNIAYIAPSKLDELIFRTYQKLAMAVQAYEKGARNPYSDECCYCKPP